MKKSITPNQIKQNNYSLIYHYIYKNRNVSQQDISYNLRLSRPTVTANLTKMENDGLIQKSGQIDTEFVGRKASAYSIVPDFRVGIGVEILKKEVKIIAVNLYGEKSTALHLILIMKKRNLTSGQYAIKFWSLRNVSACQRNIFWESALPCRRWFLRIGRRLSMVKFSPAPGFPFPVLRNTCLTPVLLFMTPKARR